MRYSYRPKSSIIQFIADTWSSFPSDTFKSLYPDRANASPFPLYTVQCTAEVVCSKDADKTLISYVINKDSLVYVNNWIEQLNIQCLPRAYIGLIGSLAFVGAFVSCFFIPALGDKFGRYTVWYTTVCLQLALFPGTNLTNNIGVIYVMCFYLGMSLTGRFACGFVLLTELNIKKY